MLAWIPSPEWLLGLQIGFPIYYNGERKKKKSLNIGKKVLKIQNRPLRRKFIRSLKKVKTDLKD